MLDDRDSIWKELVEDRLEKLCVDWFRHDLFDAIIAIGVSNMLLIHGCDCVDLGLKVLIEHTFDGEVLAWLLIAEAHMWTRLVEVKVRIGEGAFFPSPHLLQIHFNRFRHLQTIYLWHVNISEDQLMNSHP